MQILQHLNQLELQKKKPQIGLTIGNFDGVHLGHQQLLKRIKQDCERQSLAFVVVTFVPHPQKIIHPERDRFLITTYQERRNLLERMGVNYLVEMNFTRDFSTQSAEHFLSHDLLIYEGLRHFYLGYDFAFGANKMGGHNLVHDLCQKRGVSVEIQPKFEFNQAVISSSNIRQALLTGDLAQVAMLLDRPFKLDGVVIKGQGRGRKIGFPTANVQISPEVIIPKQGVYATRTHYKGMTYNSVTNIGFNPTFNDGTQIHIETNLFDFDNDIYGENLEIDFYQYIRGERKFPTVNDLIAQIKQDVDSSKAILLPK
jgi:riboflavin kinase/FMN adenylyltransferase